MTWLFGFTPTFVAHWPTTLRFKMIVKNLKKFGLPPNYKVFVKDREETFMSHLATMRLPALR